MQLIRDIGGWLLLGVLIAGAVSHWIPDGFFSRYADNEAASLAVMLAAGIPLYVCATASTPIAAALVLKGLSPGAALVFLLVGPATNAATITVLLQTIGRRACLVYLASISFCALLFGWLANRFYEMAAVSTTGWLGGGTASLAPVVGIPSAVLLLSLCAVAFVPRKAKPPARPRPPDNRRHRPLPGSAEDQGPAAR